MKRGTHVLIELANCDEKLLDDILFIRKVFRRAIKESGLVPIKGTMKFHKFNPQGLTGMVLLTSSHIAIHSWPELRYATVDIYACDDPKKVYRAVNVFIKALKPEKVKKKVLKRGFIVKEV